jgi:hypothetical protein
MAKKRAFLENRNETRKHERFHQKKGWRNNIDYQLIYRNVIRYRMRAKNDKTKKRHKIVNSRKKVNFLRNLFITKIHSNSLNTIKKIAGETSNPKIHESDGKERHREKYENYQLIRYFKCERIKRNVKIKQRGMTRLCENETGLTPQNCSFHLFLLKQKIHPPVPSFSHNINLVVISHFVYNSQACWTNTNSHSFWYFVPSFLFWKRFKSRNEMHIFQCLRGLVKGWRWVVI